MKMLIGVKDHFDASHFLPNHKGKCANLHGHTWHVEVEVEGEVNKETQMVMDLAELKQAVKDVLNVYDHQNINSIMRGIPTCEYMSCIIALRLEGHTLILGNDVKVAKVKLQEGDGGWAEWRRQ